MSCKELQLGDLEIAVLEEIWKTGQGEARALHQRIGAERGNSLSTIQSTLERLHRKNLLTRERVSHAYVYTPQETREAVMARLIECALGRFTDGRGEGLLAAFSGFAEAATDPAILDQLESMIRDVRRRQGEAGS